MEPYAGKLNSKKSQALFHNADNEETNRLFSGLSSVEVPKAPELRPEEKQIDPYEFINTRNDLLNKARIESASINDPNQVLIKGPSKTGQTEEIDMDKLMPLVRQAAESALQNLQKRPKILNMLRKK